MHQLFSFCVPQRGIKSPRHRALVQGAMLRTRSHRITLFQPRSLYFSVRASKNQRQTSWLARWGIPRPPLGPRVFPTSGFETIDVFDGVEEENLSIYKPEIFYPVHIGEVFQNRYQVVTKLGFGSSSTTWLGHDIQDGKYVSLKVHTNTVQSSHELGVYEHLKKHTPLLSPLHIRPLEGSFAIQGPHGRHDILVQEPLAVSMPDFQHKVPGKVFPSFLVKEALKQVVPCLDFLHSDAHVIHTDFHPANLLIGLSDPDECLAQVEEAELKSPAPRKVMKDRTIYTSCAVYGNIGPLYLCDFGQARIGDEGSGNVMPIPFRAPEIILGMKWSYPIDMWSVALSTWYLLQPKMLFGVYDTDNLRLNDAHHLANMIALLGPPPLDYLKRSEKYLEFWNENGDWRGIAPIPQEKTLESLEKSLNGDERARFLDFVRALLRWAPEERLTAKQALSHPWLTAPYK
ncbi:CMGC protein kinase [Durotheca rogersii]|uniref:CMGC protein kinase n=1 Tax=Durotheca rogersii TaxID=419775 RepID=UPI002220F245|nr:CMGC protein kinase [Durotheca rogersii]KAI5865813.1 CMGC protein kinase [Durotheca rogersii]